MKNAIILHGKPDKDEYYDKTAPSGSNAHWLPWLQKQLIANNVKADTPEVPDAYAPKWEKWVREVERFEMGPQTTLIGHSCGGGFWVKYLSINKKIKIKKLILVAPWMDPDGDETQGFFNDFEIDSDLANRTGSLTIFHSDNDMGNIHKTVADLRKKIKDVQYREFNNYGHFTYSSMGTNEFPELLAESLK